MQETGDGIAELRGAGLPIGGVVVNMVRPQDLDTEEREQLIDGTVDRGELVGQPGEGRHLRPATCWSRPARGGPPPRRTPPPRGQPARAGRGARTSRRTSCPAGRRRRPGRALRAGRGAERGGTRLSERSEATTHQSSRASARIGPLVATHDPKLVLDVDALLDDPERSIIVCCGSGASARPPRRRRSRCARPSAAARSSCSPSTRRARLAQSMGIEALDNTPRPVPGVSAKGAGKGGSLDAMMLDMKRTFDEVVQSQASPEKAAQILANPFYIAVSSSFAGTQEYMAMEKLGQLDKDARKTGRWDLIVVDTPPSRSALDFLDAPERLSSFLDGTVHEAAAGARARPGSADDRRLRDGHQRDHQDHRRPGAAGHEGVRGGVRHAVRRLPPARPAHLRAAPGPAYGVPGGRRAGAGRAARGGVLRRAAAPGADAAGRPGRQPGEQQARRRPVRARGDDRRRAAAQRRARTTAWPPGCSGCTPTGCASSSARSG